MIDWLKNYQFNTLLALLTYWLPLAICLLFYSYKLVQAYYTDLKRRSSDSYYFPTLTVGLILGRLVLSALPLVNVWCVVFDCSSPIVNGCLNALGRVLNHPLVKPSSKE